MLSHLNTHLQMPSLPWLPYQLTWTVVSSESNGFLIQWLEVSARNTQTASLQVGTQTHHQQWSQLRTKGRGPYHGQEPQERPTSGKVVLYDGYEAMIYYYYCILHQCRQTRKMSLWFTSKKIGWYLHCNFSVVHFVIRVHFWAPGELLTMYFVKFSCFHTYIHTYVIYQSFSHMPTP